MMYLHNQKVTQVKNKLLAIALLFQARASRLTAEVIETFIIIRCIRHTQSPHGLPYESTSNTSSITELDEIYFESTAAELMGK